MEKNWKQIDYFIMDHFNEGDVFKCIIGGQLGIYHIDNLIHDDDGDICICLENDSLVYIYTDEGELAEKHIFGDSVDESTKIEDKKNIHNWIKNKKRSETINKILNQ